MSASRRSAASRIAFCVLWLAVAGAGWAASEAAAPSSSGWQAAGSVPASAHGQSPAETWQHSSEQPGGSAPGNQVNPLRSPRTPDTPPEPATFTTPSKSNPLSAVAAPNKP